MYPFLAGVLTQRLGIDWSRHRLHLGKNPLGEQSEASFGLVPRHTTVNPNPPMRCGLGVGTKGEGHGSTTVRVRFQQMGPVAVGSCRSGRQWRTTAAALGEIGGTACSRRPSRSGLARVGGDVRLSGGGSVADGAVRPGVEWLATGPGRD